MFDDLQTRFDLYCERTGVEFWSEPVNALTNLAFVVAGLWGPLCDAAAGPRSLL